MVPPFSEIKKSYSLVLETCSVMIVCGNEGDFGDEYLVTAMLVFRSKMTQGFHHGYENTTAFVVS